MFTLLDTQFSDKATDCRVLIKYICGLPTLKENYDFEHQTVVLKKLLKYLTIFNRIFSPGKDLDKTELEGSMLSWIPKSQTQISMRQFWQQMKDQQSLDGTSLSVTYHKILTKELDVITDLQANEDTKKHMLGATGYQTLNIVETQIEPIMSQFDDQDKYNVHYWTNNNSSNNMAYRSKQKLANQPKQKP